MGLSAANSGARRRRGCVPTVLRARRVRCCAAAEAAGVAARPSAAWTGVRREYDSSNAPLEVVWRYVGGVGEVPALAMPFRDRLLAARSVARVDAGAGDAKVIHCSVLLPVVGDPETIGSCGGKSAAGSAPAKTLPPRSLDAVGTLEDGSWTAGPQRLGEGGALEAVVEAALATASARLRVVHTLHREEPTARWETLRVEVYEERPGGAQCSELDPAMAADEAPLLDASALAECATSLPAGGVSFDADLQERDLAAEAPPVAAGPAQDGDTLVRLPSGWALLAQRGGAVVVEAGWLAGAGAWRTCERRYDAETGELLSASLAARQARRS